MGDRELPDRAVEVLLALSSGPLSVHELAAELPAPPFVIRGELARLSELGLITTVLRDGRRAWRLIDTEPSS